MSVPEPAPGCLGLRKRTTRRYVLAGIAFGACFPLMAWVLDVALRGIDWSWATVWAIHATNPLHWIIDLAPPVLGAMAT